MAQYKQLITSSLQRFSVHCGSILHLKINILIYIYRLISVFPCTFFLNRHRQRYDWYEKNPFFRIRKSGLLPPELLGLTRQSPLFRTQKSLVSRLTLILHDHPHLQLRVCPPSSWTTVISWCRHRIRTVKGRLYLLPVTPDVEFIPPPHPHRFIAL